MRKLLILLLLFPLMGIAQDNNSRLMDITIINVKPGHDSQFRDGIEKWKGCYLENNGEDNWNVWKRFQGEGNVYVITGYVANWAEMGKDDPAGKSCRSLVYDFVMPHVDKVSHFIARTMPKYSRSDSVDAKLVWVTFFNVKNSTDFEGIVEKVSAAFKKANSERMGYWFGYMGGGPNDPDYMVSVPFQSYADLDMEREGPWDIYEKAVGKNKMNEDRNLFRASLNDVWSYLYSFQEDLSN